MVYSGLYPVDGSDYPDLRDALDRLQLNDAALIWEPETSVALGFGFRCGFLGLLHMEITRERLEREFDLDLISTSPNVVYRVEKEDSTELVVDQPVGLARGQGPRGVRAGREDHHHRAERVHRHHHGAVPVAARRAGRHGLPVARAGRAALHDAVGRDHLRLLRLAEVAHPRLRQPRLRGGRRAGGRSGEGRHPAAGRGRRRVQRDRAQGRGRRPTATR